MSDDKPKSKIKTGIKMATGIDALERIGRGGFGSRETHAAGVSFISTGLKKIFARPDRTQVLADPSPDPAIKFEQVAAHFGLDEAGLKRQLRATASAFWTYATLAVAWVAFSIYQGMTGSPAFIPTGSPAVSDCGLLFFQLVMGLILAGQAFKHGLGNYQIRDRRIEGLAGLMRYLRSGDLLPRAN